MATNVIVPVSEYLATMYHPDCDYVDGEVLERNLGEKDHSKLQRQFMKLLGLPESELFVDAYAEIRVQVNATRFRVPDIAVLSLSAPEEEQIIITPPLLCIEVLSPEDTPLRTRVRAQDFLNMGVLEVWIADPVTRMLYVCAGESMMAWDRDEIVIPATPLTFKLSDIFGVLNKRK